MAAIEKLHALGYDVTARISPFTPEFVDVNVINKLKCDKILVEFLRVNTWIRKWFDVDYAEYTHNHAGYRHLPLERKIELLNGFDKRFSISVCEDVPEHWEYWKEHVNSNPSDCCNLTK